MPWKSTNSMPAEFKDSWANTGVWHTTPLCSPTDDFARKEKKSSERLL
jgi:hypothetical protein